MRLDKYLKVSRLGERTLTVEVLSVQESVGKAGAALMYREV